MAKPSPTKLTTDLVGFVPLDTAERLADVLTPDDVATLKTLAQRATSPNTLRAVASDLGYLGAWHAATSGGAELPWPADEAVALRFISHHLFLAEERERDPRHGMPADVEARLRDVGVLRSELPHAPSTVTRRMSSWRTVHTARGFEGALSSKAIQLAMRVAKKAQDRPPARKSRKPVTREILDRLIGDGPPDPAWLPRELRDTTLLLVAFATGGRRRSELGGLMIERVERREDSDTIRIGLSRTKTTDASHGEFLVLGGRPLAYLDAWLAELASMDPEGGTSGPIFRAIDRWGNVGRSGLSGDTVADIVKARCVRAGLDPADYSAHGLRSGFMTEASMRGIPIEAAMRHSKHRTVQAAMRYFDDQDLEDSPVVKLGD